MGWYALLRGQAQPKMSNPDTWPANARVFYEAGKLLHTRHRQRPISFKEIMDAVGGPSWDYGWPTDYCYNRTNKLAPFEHHVFEWVSRGLFRYLGPDYPYTGPIWRRNQRVGEWNNGKYRLDV